MAAQVVITKATASTPALGGLFTSLSFFLVQRLPSRSTFIERIQANGGRVVKLENQADHVIADHFRSDCPPGSISYTFVEDALRTGTLPDPADHATRVPRGVAREAGSGAPVKGTRTPFTAEDDRVLWDWVKKSGGAVKGNDVYKQLEAVNGRHTWQAWRDRYVKKLIDRPPAGARVVVEANAPPSPPTAPDEEVQIQAAQAIQVQDGRRMDAEQEQLDEGEQEPEDDEEGEDESEEDFTKEDVDSLLVQGQDIESIDEEREEQAWSAWAQANPSHSAENWRQFWKERVRPIYLKRRKVEERKQEEEWKAMTAEDEEEKPDDDEAMDADDPDELAPSGSEVEQVQAVRSPPRKQKRPAGIMVKEGRAEFIYSDDQPDPTVAVPSSSQKRKRPATTSPAKRTYGRKKRKSANDEVFGQDESEDELGTTPKASEKPVPTSELNRQARTQLRQESGLSPRAAALVQETFRQTQTPLRQESDGSSEQPVPTSELNRLAQTQLRQEAGVSSDGALTVHENVGRARSQLRQESGLSSESLPVQESIEDPNADLQAAFDEEVFGIPRPTQAAAIQEMSNLPTSDANRAADQQLTQESLERDDEDVSSSSEAEEDEEASVGLVIPRKLEPAHMSEAPISDVNGAAGQQLAPDELHLEDEDEDDAASDALNDDEESIQSQEERGAAAHDLETASAPLTEANLASQQAQHKAPLLRGADLPEDNDAQDEEQQDEFVRYLQGLTGRASGAAVAPAVTLETQASVAVEPQVPRDDPPPYKEFDSGDLLMSSQQETDAVMDEMLQWPSSPAVSQRRTVPESQSQSMQFETQIAYPALPAQLPIASQIEEEEEEDMVPDQPSMVAEVSYPTLLQQEAESMLRSGETQRDSDEESLITSQESISSQQNVEEEEDLDLSVPAPLGGWSSSPVKPQSSEATPIASRQQVRIKQEPGLAESSPLRSQVVVTQQAVLEISSTSSSSSSSSDQEEDKEEEAAAAPESPRAAIAKRTLETQDILNAETQQPDFDLPLPPDSPNPSSSASHPSSPAPNNPTTAESQRLLAETQTLSDADIDTYITTLSMRHCYSDASIVAALKCTSMRPELAEFVLVEEKLGRGLPGNIAGIWSEEEDRMLESGNAAALRRLTEKHSWRELEGRLQFLEDWREGDKEEDEE